MDIENIKSYQNNQLQARTSAVYCIEAPQMLLIKISYYLNTVRPFTTILWLIPLMNIPHYRCFSRLASRLNHDREPVCEVVTLSTTANKPCLIHIQHLDSGVLELDCSDGPGVTISAIRIYHFQN